MATVYTTEAQSQVNAALDQGDRIADGSKISGDVLSFNVSRVIASEASSDTLYLIKLPDGARVLPHTLTVYADNPGTAYNIASVGDNADADRYSATSENISAGGVFALTAAVTGPVNDYKVGDDAADDGWITATLGTVTSATAGADVTITGQYVLRS